MLLRFKLLFGFVVLALRVAGLRCGWLRTRAILGRGGTGGLLRPLALLKIRLRAVGIGCSKRELRLRTLGQYFDRRCNRVGAGFLCKRQGSRGYQNEARSQRHTYTPSF
jgi:hypothetical protein